MSVNLKHARGPELVRRLVAECDVVTESFTPGTMGRFGLDYESLRAVRPDLVMISMPLYGQTGPWANYMGYGHVLQAAAGINHMTGWPDGPPIGTGVAYTDFLVRVAATGDFAELAAALLPCMWGFSEIGQALAARGLPAEPRYAKWVRMYADPDFAALADWCRGLVDRLAADTDAATRARMEESFLTSSRYEYLFWEMAWSRQTWPV